MGEGSELREGYAEVGDQRLHYMELLIDFFATAKQ
jgi:hypothetical protein